ASFPKIIGRCTHTGATWKYRPPRQPRVTNWFRSYRELCSLPGPEARGLHPGSNQLSNIFPISATGAQPVRLIRLFFSPNGSTGPGIRVRRHRRDSSMCTYSRNCKIHRADESQLWAVRIRRGPRPSVRDPRQNLRPKSYRLVRTPVVVRGPALLLL